MAALIKRERAERDRQLRRHVKTWVQACVQGGRGARRVHWTLRKSFVTRMRSGFFCREGSTNFKSTNYFRRPSVLHLKSSFNYCCCCSRQLAVEQVSQYTWFFLLMMMTCCYAEEWSGGQHAGAAGKRLTSNLRKCAERTEIFGSSSDSLKLLPPPQAA